MSTTPKARHRCFYCGEDMGEWTRFSDRRDPCGAPECVQYAREEALAEREEAHEQLDRDMGWGW